MKSEQIVLLLEAANNIDWKQIVLNGGPACFQLDEYGRFCNRAERWPGHGTHDAADHKYISLSELIKTIAT